MGTVKVYLSTDLEGVAGVNHPTEVTPGTEGYGRAVRLLAGEIQAVVAGAREAGADEILVSDGHGGGNNLALTDLPPGVALLRGSLRNWGMLEGLEEGADLAFFLGYHAQAGSPGTLAHTYVAGLSGVWLNGSPVGELGLNARLAAYFGVPVALVSGDDETAREAAVDCPQAQRVVVKEARSRQAARHLPLTEVHERLRVAARAAVAEPLSPPPSPKGPFELRLEFQSTALAAGAALIPGVSRPGPRLTLAAADSYGEIYRAFRSQVLLAEALVH